MKIARQCRYVSLMVAVVAVITSGLVFADGNVTQGVFTSEGTEYKFRQCDYFNFNFDGQYYKYYQSGEYFNYSSGGTNYKYSANGDYYNYFVNGQYYKYVDDATGNYYNYQNDGKYYLYNVDGNYFNSCQAVAAHWVRGMWAESQIVCK